MLSTTRVSTIWGIVGIVLGLIVFLFNYNLAPTSFPGSRIVTAPAIFALSFFSEETAFTPKLILYLMGQFIGYFTIAFAARKSIQLFKH